MVEGEVEYIHMQNKEYSELLERYAEISAEEAALKKEKDSIREILKPAFEASKKDKLFFVTLGGVKVHVLKQKRVGALQAPKIMAALGLTQVEFDSQFRAKDTILYTIKEKK